MISLRDIRYVRLGTRDLLGAGRYAREVLGLELGRQEAGTLYLRSDARDHTLVYFDGDPADHTVGFYNTFTASSLHDRLHPALAPDPVRVDRDGHTGEVYGLHGSHFASMQFHPESVLSPDGLSALRRTLTRVLAHDRLLPTHSS